MHSVVQVQPYTKNPHFCTGMGVLRGWDTCRVVELRHHQTMTTENSIPIFFQPKNSLAITGLAAHRWRDLRLAGTLVEGVHYTREARGAVYVTSMCMDGLVQGFNSPEHLAACDRWLRSLPSHGQKK